MGARISYSWAGAIYPSRGRPSQSISHQHVQPPISLTEFLIEIPHLATLTKLYMTCDSLILNILAKWLVHLKDIRIQTLVINEPFDESLLMKQLLYMYIGLILVEVAGEYMVLLVAACPKVSISNLTEQLTHLALLNVWCRGLSKFGSCFPYWREKRSLITTSPKVYSRIAGTVPHVPYYPPLRHRQDYSHPQSLEFSRTAPSISGSLFGIDQVRRW
jgi:hypothetical protein